LHVGVVLWQNLALPGVVWVVVGGFLFVSPETFRLHIDPTVSG